MTARAHKWDCKCKKCDPLGHLLKPSRGPLINGYGSTKDSGSRPAKRQNNKNHGTNRRGGGQSR